ncbi:MAG: hypothetical protein ACR2QW_06475 [bacterium]
MQRVRQIRKNAGEVTAVIEKIRVRDVFKGKLAEIQEIFIHGLPVHREDEPSFYPMIVALLAGEAFAATGRALLLVLLRSIAFQFAGSIPDPSIVV